MILEILDHDGTVHVSLVKHTHKTALEIVIFATLEHAEANLYDEFGALILHYERRRRLKDVTLEETEP